MRRLDHEKELKKPLFIQSQNHKPETFTFKHFNQRTPVQGIFKWLQSLVSGFTREHQCFAEPRTYLSFFFSLTLKTSSISIQKEQSDQKVTFRPKKYPFIKTLMPKAIAFLLSNAEELLLNEEINCFTEL